MGGESYIYRSAPTLNYHSVSFTFSLEVTLDSKSGECIFYYNVDNNGNKGWNEFYRNGNDGDVVVDRTIQLPQATWNNVNVGIRVEDTTSCFPCACHISHVSLGGMVITNEPTKEPSVSP